MQTRTKFASLLLALVAPAAQANDLQELLAHSPKFGKQVIETSLCLDTQARKLKLPKYCTSYPRFSNPAMAQSEASPTGSTGFSLVEDDDSLSKIVNDMGLFKEPEEKQRATEAIGQSRIMFDEIYRARGWSHNVAGALTFFIANMTAAVGDGKAPDDAAMNSLFKALDAELGQSHDFAELTDREKTDIYNGLFAYTSLIVNVHADAEQNGGHWDRRVSKWLASEFIWSVLNTRPENLETLRMK